MHTLTATALGWFALDALTYHSFVVCASCLGDGCELCGYTGEDQWTCR